MIMSEILQALASGMLMGFLIYFTGVGGGVLVVPFISFFFSLPVSVAVGTATAYSTLTKVLAGVGHLRAGNVSAVLFKKIMFGGVPAAIAAAVAINYWVGGDEAQQAQRYLEALIIAVILAAFLLTVFRVKPRTTPPWAVAAMGLFIGAAIGATGVGGGVLIIPALLAIGSNETKQVVGTSVLIALCLSALTAAIYAGGGQFDLPLALWMSVGSLLGVPIAGRLFKRASDGTVRICVLVAIAVALLLMILKWFEV